MRSAEKQQTVTDLSERLGGAKCLYLTDFTGLDVAAINDLRRKLASAEVEYIVVKNTLARRALAGGPYEALAPWLEGPSAIALSHVDVVSAAKVLTDFAKERDKPRIKAGAIEGQVLSLDEIRSIAALPSREALLAQVVGSVRAPIANLVGTLQSLLAKFVRTVDAVRALRAEMRAQPEQGSPSDTDDVEAHPSGGSEPAITETPQDEA